MTDAHVSATDQGTGADLVLFNGRILTMSGSRPVVSAIAIRGGRILSVGSDAEVAHAASGRATRIDLRGRTALPGLSDVHVHLASDAARGEFVDVRDFFDPTIRSVADVEQRISGRAEDTPAGEWIVAMGSPLQEHRFVERRLPTKRELDLAAPAHPCVISFGAHITIANSRALTLSGIDANTASPEGGAVERSAEDDAPTGVLRERAQRLLKIQRRPLSIDGLAERILVALRRCAARGVTSIHDIVISRDEIQAYQQLARQGSLPLRVQLLIRVIESRFSKESLLDLGLVQGFGSDWLRLGGVKMSIDGGITANNAAFSEPLVAVDYHGGLIRIGQDELDDVVWRYHSLGMRCCVHALGDVAMDMALRAYEKAFVRLQRPDHRHRIEHLGNWMMTAERISLVRRLGIQPVPNPSLLYFLGRELTVTLGPKRSEGAFPFRTLLDAGVPLVFGADAPDYWPVDPLRDLGAAVSRTSAAGAHIGPEQAITLDEALRAQTASAAFLGFVEDRLGTLEPGKLADVAVLGEDPFAFPAERFAELPVDMTISGGRVVHLAT